MVFTILTDAFSQVLHPWFRDTYIKMAWGGEEERLIEIEAGNRDAKNWQEEAMKILEKAVSLIPFYSIEMYLPIRSWLVIMHYYHTSQCRWLPL